MKSRKMSKTNEEAEVECDADSASGSEGLLRDVWEQGQRSTSTWEERKMRMGGVSAWADDSFSYLYCGFGRVRITQY